eukprot:UN14666
MSRAVTIDVYFRKTAKSTNETSSNLSFATRLTRVKRVSASVVVTQRSVGGIVGA